MQHGVVRDVMDPTFQFICSGQFAEQKQPRNFEIRAVLGQHVDGIAAVAQDSFIAVDVSDGASTGSGIHEGGVVGHQAEIVGSGFDLAKIHRADGSVFDRNGVVFSGTVVGDRQGVLRHPGPPAFCRDSSNATSTGRGLREGRLREASRPVPVPVAFSSYWQLRRLACRVWKRRNCRQSLQRVEGNSTP